MKCLKDLFNSQVQLLQLLDISSEWATADNLAAADNRLYCDYYDKPLDLTVQHGTLLDAKKRITSAVMSQAYQLDTLYSTITAVYDPIKNYDMVETSTDGVTSDSTTGASDSTTTYDSSDLRLTGQSDGSAHVISNTTHTLTRSGNIGVTTTQQMLQSSRDLALFDFYSYVSQIVIDAVCSGFFDNGGDCI